MSATPDNLRHAMRKWATGVTVVTTRYKNVQHGMTVSSFTSLSLDPPLVMISLENQTRTFDVVRKAQAFGVTILSAEQQHISVRFADPQTDAGYRFSDLETFNMSTGSPFIKGGLACFDCRVVNAIAAGSQTVFIGEVVAILAGSGSRPLVYFNQAYRELGD